MAAPRSRQTHGLLWRRKGNSKMRLVSAVAAATLAASMAAPAAEAGSSAYLGLRGSLVQTDDGDTTSGPLDFSEKYTDLGYAAGVYMGWVLDENFRFELSADYRANDLDSIHMVRNDFDPDTNGGSYPVGGHAEAGAFMGNIFYDVHFLGDLGFLPWVGAGVGAAYIDYNLTADIYNPNTDITTVLAGKDNVWAFAYQFMAGITVPLADSLSGSIGYRYFRTQDFTYTDRFGVDFQTNLTQQSIDVGLQFHL
jgi:opacity protein-like surface antigen